MPMRRRVDRGASRRDLRESLRRGVDQCRGHGSFGIAAEHRFTIGLGGGLFGVVGRLVAELTVAASDSRVLRGATTWTGTSEAPFESSLPC